MRASDDPRRATAAMLLAQADAFGEEEAQAVEELPFVFPSAINRPGKSILRDEAARLLSVPASPIKGHRRSPRLRICAGTTEILQAFSVLQARVNTLTKRLDKTYERVERDEVELESLLETIEAAAHDTMDWTPDEQCEADEDEDKSTDDDDADIAFAASLSRPGGRMSASASQAKALGWSWLSQADRDLARPQLQACASPED